MGSWSDEKDDHSLLKRNVAIGAGDDGFDVQSRSTKLTGNRAVRNGDLGIEAVRGVIDGGGNMRDRQRRPTPVHAHRVQLIGANQPPLTG